MAIFKRFGEVFLIFFGVYILYFNLVMAINVVGSDSPFVTPFLGLYAVDNSRWTSDYYFGFESIYRIIKSIPSIFQYNNFLESFRKFVNTLAPLESVLTDLKSSFPSSATDILGLLKVFFNIFKVFFDILISPFTMLINFLKLQVDLFQSIIQVLDFIHNVLNGNYNMPISDWSSPLENYFENIPYYNGGNAVPPVASVEVSGGVVVVH